MSLAQQHLTGRVAYRSQSRTKIIHDGLGLKRQRKQKEEQHKTKTMRHKKNVAIKEQNK